MKNKYFLLLLILLFSCNKITPEINNKSVQDIKQNQITKKNWINKIPNSIPEDKIIQEWKPCWTISCDVKKYLKEKFWTWENIKWLELYKQRLWIILDSNKNIDKLIESKKLKVFTDDFYKQYFWCEWNVYKCSYNLREYSEDELNYIFYVFIPQMVIDEYVIKREWDESFTEDIIQAIKRKDFTSNDLKNAKIKIYKQKLDDFVNNLDLNLYNKEKLLNNEEYFYEKLLKPQVWLHDIIMNKSVNWKMTWLDWKNKEQLKDITEYTINTFYSILLDLWVNKNQFITKIKKINWYDANILESIKADIINKSNKLETKYQLKNKLVYDRYFRNDELNIFSLDKYSDTFQKISWEWKENEYYNDILEIWSKVMLLFNLWFEEEYYFMPKRLEFYNNSNTFLITNIFKIYKYIDWYNYKVEQNIIY